MSVECQVNVKSQSELDIGVRETCNVIKVFMHAIGDSICKNVSVSQNFSQKDLMGTLFVQSQGHIKKFEILSYQKKR